MAAVSSVITVGLLGTPSLVVTLGLSPGEVVVGLLVGTKRLDIEGTAVTKLSIEGTAVTKLSIEGTGEKLIKVT